MPVSNIIGPDARPTPAEIRGAPQSRRPLPDDLLREASRRLGIMALMSVGLWISASVLNHFAYPDSWRSLLPLDGIAGLAVLVSGAVYAYTRRKGRDPARVLDIALGFMVVNAVATGFMTHWVSVYMIVPMFTGIAPLILMFPAIIPTPPTRTFVASLIAASMDPLGMLVAKWRGIWDFGPLYNVLVMHFPDYLMVPVAVVISVVVTRMGQHVTKAREMGSYHMGELLGRGGMGEVYRATHRMLARPAAIKLIRPEMIAPGGGDAALLAVPGSGGKPRSRRICGPPTPSSSTISA